MAVAFGDQKCDAAKSPTAINVAGYIAPQSWLALLYWHHMPNGQNIAGNVVNHYMLFHPPNVMLIG